MNIASWLALLAIPVCSELNHLGGQSVDIPNSRIVCRVFGIPVAIFIISLLCGLPLESSAWIMVVEMLGMALWAVFHWGQMFMAINGMDYRDYSRFSVIARICDAYCGVSSLSKLTARQCRQWGTVWGTLRGGFLFPMFIALSILMTPWAFPIGILCFSQGIIYRTSDDVLAAEYRFGAVIGLMFALILMAAA